MSNNHPLLPPAAAAKYLQMSRSYLAKLRVTGNGPVYIKHNRLIRYRLPDLDEWVEPGQRKSTSAIDGGLKAWLPSNPGNLVVL